MHILKMDNRLLRNSRGFTLIEAIISLVVAGVLGAMLVSFMSTGVIHSANPVILARNGAYLNEIMENMAADYTALQVLNPGPTGLNNFYTNVGTANKYGSGYTVSTKEYISIPSGTPASASTGVSFNPHANNILQVTVTYQGLTATALFGG